MQTTHNQEMKVERFLITMLEHLGSAVLESRDPWPFWLDVHQYIFFLICQFELGLLLAAERQQMFMNRV